MAALRVVDYLLAIPLPLMQCSLLANLGQVQSHNCNDEPERAPRAPNDYFAKRRDGDARAQQAAQFRPPMTCQQATKQLSTDCRLPYSRVKRP